MAQVGGDDGQRDDHDAADKGRNAGELLTQHRHQHTEHADQGKGAQSDTRRRYALALQPDQQTDSGRNQEGFDLGGIERQAVGHGGGPGATPRTAERRPDHDMSCLWTMRPRTGSR